MPREDLENAPNPDEVRNQDLAYYDLGDLIFDQNPYGGYDEPAPGTSRKFGRMRLADGVPTAVSQYEAKRPAMQKFTLATLPTFDTKTEPFASSDLQVAGVGSAFAADDTYKEMVPAGPVGGFRPGDLLRATGLMWSFGTQTIRVSKAMRIRYTVVDRDDPTTTVDHYLIIGFEGAGGM